LNVKEFIEFLVIVIAVKAAEALLAQALGFWISLRLKEKILCPTTMPCIVIIQASSCPPSSSQKL
jgi:hypothetical protein